MTEVGDIYMWRECDPMIVIGIESLPKQVYKFKLVSLRNMRVHTWVEPFSDILSPLYYRKV